MFDRRVRLQRAVLRFGTVLFLSGMTFGWSACEGGRSGGSARSGVAGTDRTPGVLNAGFVVTESVFNSELMAPFDIFHHTIFRDDSVHIRPFIVSPDGKPVHTFEGLTIEADYSFASSPPIDILVIPSTDGSMSRDLNDAAYLSFIESHSDEATWVLTLCDGAFPLAETGVLNGRIATTFPGDRDAFAERFPDVDLRYDVRFAVDGKYVTSVGGARSYEPALWIVEQIQSRNAADLTAEGMVLEWSGSEVPHVVNGTFSASVSE